METIRIEIAEDEVRIKNPPHRYRERLLAETGRGKFRKDDGRDITFFEFPIFYTPLFIAKDMGYVVEVVDEKGEIEHHDPYEVAPGPEVPVSGSSPGDREGDRIEDDRPGYSERGSKTRRGAIDLFD